MNGWETYQFVVAEFRRITGVVGPSGRCCAAVRDGVPKCCYQLVDGEELTFTNREIRLLVGAGVTPAYSFWPNGRDLYVLNRQRWFGDQMVKALNDGWLADTLECASHPTRPILIGERVVGVACVMDCNTMVAFDRYTDQRQTLMHLWQAAVVLTGMKPYYVTSYIDDGLIVL